MKILELLTGFGLFKNAHFSHLSIFLEAPEQDSDMVMVLGCLVYGVPVLHSPNQDQAAAP